MYQQIEEKFAQIQHLMAELKQLGATGMTLIDYDLGVGSCSIEIHADFYRVSWNGGTGCGSNFEEALKEASDDAWRWSSLCN